MLAEVHTEGSDRQRRRRPDTAAHISCLAEF